MAKDIKPPSQRFWIYTVRNGWVVGTGDRPDWIDSEKLSDLHVFTNLNDCVAHIRERLRGTMK